MTSLPEGKTHSRKRSYHMTLLFDSSILPPEGTNDVFGFIQTSHIPTDFILTKGDPWLKCKSCGSSLFLLDDETSFDCPICHPENSYSKHTFKVIDKKLQTKRRHYIVLDISMDLASMASILRQFVECLADTDEVWVVFISEAPIFCCVSNSVLFFDTPASGRDMTVSDPSISLKYRISKKQLNDVVIPSVSSVCALRRVDGEQKCDLWLVLQQVFENRGQEPAVVYAFVASKVADVPVSDDFMEVIERNKDIVCHIGLCNDGFLRATTVSRGSLGCVFRLGYVSKNIVRKLVDSSLREKRVITFPACLSLGEVVGRQDMRIKKDKNVIKVVIPSLSGGAGTFTFDATKTDFSIIRVVEKVVTDTAEFMTLHTFQNSNGFGDVVDRNVMNTISLKIAADTALRALWRRRKFDAVISAFKAGNEANNSLKNLGTDKEADMAALYYVLASIGVVDLEEKVYQFDGKWVLVSPPQMYILSETGRFDGYGPWDVKKWPFDISVISTKEEFQAILQMKHIEDSMCD